MVTWHLSFTPDHRHVSHQQARGGFSLVSVAAHLHEVALSVATVLVEAELCGVEDAAVAVAHDDYLGTSYM